MGSRLLVGFTFIAVVFAMIFQSGTSQSQPVDLGEGWHPKIPNVTGIYKTTPASSWPLSYDSQGKLIQNEYGHTSYMLLSLSGLAAKACFEGRNNQVIEVDMRNYPYSSQIAWQDLLTRVNLADLGTLAPWDLVDLFKGKGIVKGFVVYHYETGNRGLWNYSNGGPYDPSANVATVYAHELDAILIEQSQVSTALAHGLSQLADCRGITQEQCWATFKNQVYRKAVVACDPKVCWNRDYAVATGAFCLFPMDPNNPLQPSAFYRDVVLPWMEGPFPVLGWGGGDEYGQTHAPTINGGFNTATSYDVNLLVHGLFTPGVSDSISLYQLNRKSGVDPVELEWERDTHYTAFIMSDGDFFGLNNTYIEDTLSNYGEYFGHPQRGLFPMTWSCACADMIQLQPSTVRTLTDLSTPNDSFILMGGGYYYPDLFPDLLKHMQRIRPLLKAMDLHTWTGNFTDYDSPSARQAQGVIASTLDAMTGLFPIQYSPYTAGRGNIYWTPNSNGYRIPVISARYAIWANSSFPGEGSPLKVAQEISSAPRTGESTNPLCFDWTVVHIWSFFKNCQNMNQSSAYFSPSQGIERCYASAKCCFTNLLPHVRVVSAEKLAWLAALHLETRDTLLRILDSVEEDLPEGGQTGIETALLQFWRNRLGQTDFSSEPRKREGFFKIQDVARAIRSGSIETEFEETFESALQDSLPWKGWIDSLENPQIVQNHAASGTRSLRIPEGGEVDKLVYMDAAQKVSFQARVDLGKTGPPDLTPPSAQSTVVLRFSSQGVLPYDGNGFGGGQWQPVNLDLSQSTWITVRIQLDFSAHEWDLYVNDQPVASHLGFVNNTTDRLHGMKFSGDQHVDDIQVSEDGPTINSQWPAY